MLMDVRGEAAMAGMLFSLPTTPVVAVKGEAKAYPVGRIFGVGRNYAVHAAEMGIEADRESPTYFTKSPGAACESGRTVAYPPGTKDFHYEMELVVALGASVFRATAAQAAAAIFAYGCGLDMTRRDLQRAAFARRRPSDLGKDVEDSAVFAPLTRAAEFGAVGSQRIHLAVNGAVKQDARLCDMIHDVVGIIVDLSRFYHLRPGDLIMTGTPAGVGPVMPGDVITGGIDGLDPVNLTVGTPE